MKNALAAAAALATVLGGHAAAQQAHGSLGVIVDEGFDDLGAVGRVGYDFNANFGVEGELNYFSTDVVGVDVDVFAYIAFAKAQTNVNERVSVFARLGYGGITADPDGFESETEDAFAYGVGAEYAVAPNGAIRADYTRYDLGEGGGDDEGFLSLSYALRFGGPRQ